MSKKNKKLIISVSMGVHNELKQHYGVESEVINNCVDTRMFEKFHNAISLRRKLNLSNDCVVGIYAGRWDEYIKRTHLLLRLARLMPDITWLFVTDQSNLAKEYPLKNVIWMFNIPYHEMPEIYGIADFAIQPSIYEGFGYFALESMSCSVPVVSRKVGFLNEERIVGQMKDLFIKDAHSDDESLDHIIEKIIYLRDNPDRRIRHGNDLRVLAEKYFSIDTWHRSLKHTILGEEQDD